MNKWIQKTYAVLMTFLCLFQYVGSMTQVVAADTDVPIVVLNQDKSSIDETKLSLSYAINDGGSQQTASFTIEPKGALKSTTDGELKNSDDKQVGTYTVKDDTLTFDIAEGANGSELSVPLQLSQAISSVTLTNTDTKAATEIKAASADTETSEQDAEVSSASSSESESVSATEPAAATSSQEDASETADTPKDLTNVAKVALDNFEFLDGNDKPISSTGNNDNGDPEYTVTGDSKLEYDYTFAIPTGTKVNDGDYLTFTMDLPKGATAKPCEAQPLAADKDGVILGTYQVLENNQVKIVFNKNAANKDEVCGTFTHKQSIESMNLSETETITIPVSDQKTVQLNQPNTNQASIEKTHAATVVNDNQITWSVDINKTRGDMTNATVTDKFIPELSLHTPMNETGVTLVDVTEGGATVSTAGYTLDTKNHGIVLQFINALRHTDHEYKLTYTTDVSSSGTPGDFSSNINQEFDKSQSFENDATLSTDELKDKPLTAKDTAAIKYGSLISKYGEAQDGQVFNWHLNYNNGQTFIPAGTSIIDTWDSDAMQYVDGSVVVTKVNLDGNGDRTLGDVIDKSAYHIEVGHVTKNDDGTYAFEATDKNQNGFKFVWDKSINQAVQIWYQTKVDETLSNDPGTLTNHVSAGGNAETDYGSDYSGQQLDKSLGAVDYNKKTRKLQEQVSHPMARHREMNCYL